MKKHLITLFAVTALVLTGCSGPSPVAPETAEVVSLNAIFGETVTYEDGVSVSVSVPEAYIPTDSAAGTSDGDSNVIFTITVANGSKDSVDVAGWPTVISGGQKGSAIIDDIVGNHHAEEIKPGKSTSWKEAFSVKDASDISLSYSAGVDKKDVAFKTE